MQLPVDHPSKLRISLNMVRLKNVVNVCLSNVKSGCIKPLCDLLTSNDPKVVVVALEGLENILRVGEQQTGPGQVNSMAVLIDEAEGVQKIQSLQYHVNEGIVLIFVKHLTSAKLVCL